MLCAAIRCSVDVQQDAISGLLCLQGVADGLESLKQGGIQPRTLIIDDGWQMTEIDEEYEQATTTTEKRTLWLRDRFEEWNQHWGTKAQLPRPPPGDNAENGAAGTAAAADGAPVATDSKTANGASSPQANSGGKGNGQAGMKGAKNSSKSPKSPARIGTHPLMGSMDEDFAESQQSVLASFADDLAGGSELMMTMPALADAGAPSFVGCNLCCFCYALLSSSLYAATHARHAIHEDQAFALVLCRLR